jgi:phage virion morphogenesis protein
MAGARIEIDDRQVLAALRRLEDFARNPDLALRDIGEALLGTHRARFEDQEAPDGTPWAALDPKYQARKRRNAERILVLEGWLRDQLSYQVDGQRLELGTARIYGATHQFGREEAGIPARPFLGLSEADQAEILEILREHLEAGLGGRGALSP